MKTIKLIIFAGALLGVVFGPVLIIDMIIEGWDFTKLMTGIALFSTSGLIAAHAEKHWGF